MLVGQRAPEVLLGHGTTVVVTLRNHSGKLAQFNCHVSLDALTHPSIERICLDKGGVGRGSDKTLWGIRMGGSRPEACWGWAESDTRFNARRLARVLLRHKRLRADKARGMALQGHTGYPRLPPPPPPTHFCVSFFYDQLSNCLTKEGKEGKCFFFGSDQDELA